MSRRTSIQDGEGTGKNAVVDPGGYLYVQPAPFPPDDNRDIQLIYRQFLTLNGDGTTSDMLVDGSITSQIFTIPGKPNNDIYITSLSFVIAGDGLALGNDFAGSGSPLTNGCRLYYEDSNGEVNIGTSLQTNFDFIRLCQGNPAFADPTLGPFIANDIAGASGKGSTPADGILPVLNFRDVFGFQYGLKIARSTTHQLALEINDNLTTGLGLNAAFNVIAYGFERKQG
jgi:hypothetical protein